MPTTTPPADDATGAPAYAAVLESVTDPEHLRVTVWILEEMTSTFLMLAFADACDACDDAGTPHPDKPGPGGNFADFPTPAPEVRAAAERAAMVLLADILAAPGGYDPAPAVIEWHASDDNNVSDYWLEKVDVLSSLEATARCWGHYAVMEAMGHGVAWSDSNEPLSFTDIGGKVHELPAVGRLGVHAEDVTWSDEYTEAARGTSAARFEVREDATGCFVYDTEEDEVLSGGHESGEDRASAERRAAELNDEDARAREDEARAEADRADEQREEYERRNPREE
jgi:hypothetical protein